MEIKTKTLINCLRLCGLDACDGCPYQGRHDCLEQLLADAADRLEKLDKSKEAQKRAKGT